ncbi:MAG: class I SAM-dependent methyltransferase [Burkholderiaceae bacterium]|nr:class I SAM-dependent methyltransferase [Burkholderiaceae bacterium]
MEVGVGSGRFAQALGIECGVDPAPEMAKHARSRGINASVGYGENLPYPDTSFDGVLMVCTICFVENAGEVLSERSRVLKPGAHLLIGFVPLDSVWVQYHSLRGKAGHTYYAGARFFSEAELIKLAAKAGLVLKQTTIGCELPAPKSGPSAYPDGMNPTRGVQSFRALLFGKNEIIP